MGKSQNFEELETPHIIIVEDKTIKWLISDLIKKINGNYNIIEKNENIDYVKNDKKNVYCCCIYTLKNGKSQIKVIPDTSGFQNLKSIFLIADNDAKKEIEDFRKKLEEKKKNEEIELDYHYCLIPSKSEDGNEIEDYICNKSENSDKVKFKEIENFIESFIGKFQLNISRPIKRISKRKLNILLYIESENLNDLEKDKYKYVKNIINNINEKEEVFAELKNFLDNAK